MKEEILKAVKKAYPEAKISLEDIELEHPAAEEHGDYSTNIAFKLAKRLDGRKSFLENIDWIVRTINKDNFEDYKEPVPVGRLLPNVQKVIGAKNDLVYLKPRIYAKWCGWWREHRGHEEILPFLGYLPSTCFSPLGVYKDRGDTGRFLLSFNVGHFGMLVIEILEEKNKNEIVTAFYFDKLRLSEYEEILNLEKSSLGKLRPASLLAPRLNSGVAGAISSLQESQEFYNTLDQKSQEEILFYQEKLTPQVVAEKIVAQLRQPWAGGAKNGFINFWLSKEELIEKMNPKAENNSLAGKKIMVEFAHPNTHKQFHIGHLRNITLGETVSRLLTACGAKIIRANYQGDVGMHVAKALWGVQKLGKTDGAYVLGNKAFEEDEKAKKEIVDLNKKIYQKDPEIMPLWQRTRQESLDYFDKIYQRVYTHFDRLYFESEVAGRGKQLVLENVGKVFEKSEGAIIFRGEHTRVFVNSEGNPTYEAKDMGLGELQFKEYQPDLIIHNVGPEQTAYFEVIFAALAKILPQTAGREKHLAYGWVKLKEGKMSSRTGNVVLGEWLLDEIKKRLGEKYPERPSDLEPVAVAAAKYSLLKVGREQEIAFDIDESISLEGDSGPYLQYTYARARSVLRKSASQELLLRTQMQEQLFKNEELAILRYLYRFPEVVEQAAKQYSPNLICSYLFELAKRFNNFYNNVPILQKKEDFSKNIEWLLEKVKKDNFHNFSHPVAVGKLNPEVVKLLKAETDVVVLKPLIFAKLAGWVQPKFKGHAEVISLLPNLPLICFSPQAIYKDKEKNRYIFSYEISHFGILVVEVSEKNYQNEIVTMFLTDKKWAERFEKIWTRKNNSPGRRRISSLQASGLHRTAGAGLSSLRESKDFYSTLDQKSQEEEAFRLGLTAATVRVLKTGLNLLGIEALEKM